MGTSLSQNVLQRIMDRQRRRLAAIEQLQAILEEFPDLSAELLGDRALPGETPTRPSPSPRASGTAFERVARLFFQNGNDWLDTSVITIGSGVSRNVVATILWSAHKNDF